MGHVRGTWLAVALALAAGTGRAQEAGDTGRPVEVAWPHRDAVLEALAGLRETGADGVAACQERLAALGRPAVPALVALLMDPASAADEGGLLIAPEGLRVLVEVLLARPASEVLPELHAALLQVDTLEDRRRCVKLMGQLGDATSLEPLLELVAGMEPARRQLHTIQRELEAAISQILRRQPQAAADLAARSEGLEPLLQAVAARGVGAAGNGRGLAALERMLGRTQAVDRAVLEAVGRLDPSDPDSAGCAAVLAWHLTSDDPEARRAAALSLGPHGGAEQLDALIALLDDTDPRCRAAAHWSLGRIAGLDLGPEPAAWTAWYRRELDWYGTRAARLLESAAEAPPAVAFEALREVAAHPLFRRELAVRLAPVLARRETPLALAACSALTRLGGPDARASLEALRADGRGEVQRAAEAALRALGEG